MRIKFLLFQFIILSLQGYSQTRGVIYSSAKKDTTGKSYALIIGISKYKNSEIPSLQFADKDALAFYRILLENECDSANMILLLNEKARAGNIWASISYLIGKTSKNDKVFIYFSGHGDVENNTVAQDAFLLPYDSPRKIYPSGAIAVTLLKNYLGTLSSKGVQVIFIADACRSGNLAGGEEGMRNTSNMLKEKWVDEIKILSCQPGELSLESKKWGKGRGLFSYYLTKGLSGSADKNGDGAITLRELNLYLLDKVDDEAKPMNQNPVIVGDYEFPLIKNQSKRFLFFKWNLKDSLKSNSIHAGDSGKFLFRQFSFYLDSGFCMNQNPNKPCAFYYYLLLHNGSADMKELASIAERNLIAAIINDVNDFQKSFMAPSFQHQSKSFITVRNEATILRSIIANNHTISKSIIPKILVLESFSKQPGLTPQESFVYSIHKLDSALMIDSGSAVYVYYSLSSLYSAAAMNAQALVYARRIYALSPQWSFAAYRFSSELMLNNKLDSALSICTKALSEDSDNLYLNNLAGDLKLMKGEPDSAYYYYNNASYIDLGDGVNYANVADFYMLRKDYQKALNYYLKAQHDDNPFEVRYQIAMIYALLGIASESIHYLESCLRENLCTYDMIRKEEAFNRIRNDNDFINFSSGADVYEQSFKK